MGSILVLVPASVSADGESMADCVSVGARAGVPTETGLRTVSELVGSVEGPCCCNEYPNGSDEEDEAARPPELGLLCQLLVALA